MNEEILKKIKIDYEKLKTKKEESIKIYNRITELENNEFVKEYLELISTFEERNLAKNINISNDDLIYKAFLMNKHKITQTNEIYMYLGTYKLDSQSDVEHGISDQKVARNDPEAQYRMYIDIENEEYKQIPIKYCDEFEETHKIIYLNKYFTEKYFYIIQKEFIENLINIGQEEACTKVLKKSFSKT